MPARKKLPPNVYTRTYRTQDGRKRTLYYVQFLDWKGIRRTWPAGDDIDVAIQLRDRYKGQNTLKHDFDVDNRPPPTTTFFARAKLWLSVTTKKASHTKDQLSVQRLKSFFEDTELTSLTTSRIEEYRAHREKDRTRYGKPPSPATINRELACLRSILTLAVADRILPVCPEIRFLPENNERTRTWTEKEYTLVRDSLPAEFHLLMQLYWECGARAREIVHLRWEQVDLQGGWLLLERLENKERKKKNIPMSDRSLTALTAHYEASTHQEPAEQVFWYNGQPLTYYQLAHHLRKAMQQHGLTGLWLHDLRGTFITRKLDEGWDRKFIKGVTGHRTDVAFDRYVRPTDDMLKRLINGNADISPTQPFSSAQREQKKPLSS